MKRLVILLVCFAVLKIASGTDVSGVISTDSTWDISGSPYTVTGEITVLNGVTLTVDPNVEVKFNNGIGMMILGNLTASSALFTSNQPVPASGDWNYIHVGDYYNAGTVSLNNCNIRYAHDFIVYNGVASLSGTNIEYSYDFGVTVYGTLNMVNGSINLSGSSSYWNSYGVNAMNGSYLALENVNILNCRYGLLLNGGSDVTLTDCDAYSNEWPIYYADAASLTLNGNCDFSGNSYNGIYIGFINLPSSWILPYSNVPYYFSGSFTVNNTGSLIVGSGNILKFAPGGGLWVDGTFYAEALPGQNIFFTSFNDDNWGGDTNNDGASTNPAPGDWFGVTFNDQSNDAGCVLKRCNLRFAGAWSTGNVNTVSASPTIDNCDLSNSYYGIRMQYASNPVFTNNTIGSSQMTPIALSYEANPVFSGNVLSFSDNAYDAIGLLGGTLTANAVLPIRNVTNVPNITYLMLENITIPQGLTLTINKGIVIKGYADSKRFIVNGDLIAVGTPDSMIVFTSARDDNFGNPFDTNKDGSQTSPLIGDWGGITFKVNTNSLSKLQYCRLYYGDNNDYTIYPTIAWWVNQGGQITLDNASPEILDCDIKHCEFGVYCGGNSSPNIWNTSFDNTTITPVAKSLSAAPSFSGNTLFNPGYWAIGLIGEELGVSGTLGKTDFAGYSNMTYLLLQDLFINSGTYITVDSGIIIKANPGSKIEVNGGFKLAGGVLPGNEIVFTSLKDDNAGNPNDTNGDGSSSSPAAGDWKRLQYNETSDDGYCILQNFQLKYGGYTDGDGNSGALAFVSANTIVDNLWILNSSSYGFWVNGSSVPVISHAIIQNCVNDPIAMSLLSDPQFSDIVFQDNGSNGIRIIEGTLSSNAYLAKRDVAGINNIAYIVNNLTIASSAALTIEPGVVIKFSQNTNGEIIVHGALKANGTPGEKIVFTSERDDSQGGDTNNDGNASIPAKGDWLYISFYDSGIDSLNLINNCIFSYGGRFHWWWDGEQSYGKRFGEVNIYNTRVIIDSCAFEQSGISGIGIYGNADPVITNSEFNNIDFTPVSMSMFSNPAFSGITLSNVGLTGLGVAIENYSVNAVVPQRSFAGYDNITYILYSFSPYGYMPSINSGTHITIPEGIVFKTLDLASMQSGWSCGFLVNGSLSIQGSVSNKVVITDYRDDSFGNPLDTNGDGLSTTPQIKSGYAIHFTELSDDPNCIINYATLRYQDNAIEIQQASPGIQNCLFEHNNWGISMAGISQPLIDYCTFHNLVYTPLLFSVVSYPASTTNNIISGTTYKALGVKGETMAQNISLPKRSFAGMTNTPYYFHQNFYIGTSSIMTVSPGVILKFNSDVSLTVRKGLMAEAGSTLGNAIIFTDIRDDFYGGDSNSDSTATQPGFDWNTWRTPWGGIIFENESNDAFCKLNNCKIRYAGYNYPFYSDQVAGIRTNNASPSILYSSVMFNRVGIYANGASNPFINYCDIYGNELYGVMNAGMAFNIKAENCWWGNNTGPSHSGNPAGTGDAVTDMVDYIPFRTNGANVPLMGDVSLNGSVMAYDASLLMFYVVDPVGHPLNTKQLQVADVSGNGSATAYDASLILQYVVGLINYFPAELLSPVPVYTSEVELEIGDLTVLPGEEFSLPLTISNVSNIYAMQLELGYDPAILDAVDVEPLLPGMNPTFYIDAENGHILLAFAGTIPLEEGMVIANLRFRAAEGLSGSIETGIMADLFMANETDLSMHVNNGVVTINGLATGISNQQSELYLDCFPNPFKEEMNIRFRVNHNSGNVDISVFDIYGNRVATLLGGAQPSGSQHILWNGTGTGSGPLPGGVYFVKMSSGSGSVTKKIQIVR